MQDQLVECEQCETESEEYECPQCGLTGAQLADQRWTYRLWVEISLN